MAKPKKKISNTHSQEFLEREKLVCLDLDLSQRKHKMRMREFEYTRESDRLHHERELERGRIKSAEIRKAQERKNAHELLRLQERSR